MEPTPSGPALQRWLPWLVAVLLALLSIAGLVNESSQERSDLQRIVGQESILLQQRLEEGLSVRLLALQRMRGRLEDEPGYAAVWTSDARRYLDDFPSLDALVLLDGSPRRLDAVERTTIEGWAAQVAAVLADTLRRGGAPLDGPTVRPLGERTAARGGLVAFFPYSSRAGTRYFAVLFDLGTLIRDLLPSFPPGTYRIGLSDEAGLFYDNYSSDPPERADRGQATTEVPVLDRHWQLTVTALPDLIQSGRASTARFTFLLGLAVALLGGLLTAVTLRARQHQRMSERRFQELFESVPLGLYRSTPDGRVVVANRALMRIFGFPDLTTLRRAGALAVYPDSEDRRRWQRMLEERDEVLDHEVEIRRYDGSPTWVSLSVRAVRDPAGETIAYDGVMEDISERRRAQAEKAELEAQLLQSQKMEAVGRLAGGIAHDFNNLITVITGNAELAASRLPSDDPLRGRLNTITRAAQHAASLTGQLLSFSRKEVTAPRPLELNRIVANLDPMLHRLVGEDIRLVLELAAEPCPIVADQGQIQQVLLNLVVNAREAMPTGGRIIIRTGRKTVGAERIAAHATAGAGEYAYLSVEDTGRGMTSDVAAHIFEPFFTTKESGTGLGLATVYGIVQQYGGFPEVTSSPGQGTRIKVLLPLALDSAAAPSAPASLPPAGGRGERILVVEDEDPVRELVSEVLVNLAYEVVSFGDPVEASRWFRQHPEMRFDLLLTDVVMPGRSGVDLAGELRTVQPDLRVLYMSGYTDDSVLRHGVREGEVELIQKPFEAHHLAERVRELLDTPSGRP